MMDFEWGPSVETVLWSISTFNLEHLWTLGVFELLFNCPALNDCWNNVTNDMAMFFQIPNIIRNPMWNNKRKYQHKGVKSSNSKPKSHLSMKLIAWLIKITKSSAFNKIFPSFLTKSDLGQYSIKVLEKHPASSTGPWLPWGATCQKKHLIW